jgi:hypothetical protein
MQPTLTVDPGQNHWNAEEVPALTAAVLYPEERNLLLVRVPVQTSNHKPPYEPIGAKDRAAVEKCWDRADLKSKRPAPDLDSDGWAPFLRAFNKGAPASRGWLLGVIRADRNRSGAVTHDADLARYVTTGDHEKALRSAIESLGVAAQYKGTNVPVAGGDSVPLDRVFLTRAVCV